VLSKGLGSSTVRRRHGGRRPAFTEPHPSNDNQPWRSGGCPVKPQPLEPRTVCLETHFGARCGIVVLHGRPRGEEQGWRIKAFAAFSVAPHLRCFALPQRCHWLTKRS
jgi:hypothetical protein